MTLDPSFAWLVFGLSVVGIAASAAVAVFSWRSWRGRSESAQAFHRAVLFAGPLARLDFAQSLDPKLFAQAAEEETLAWASRWLADGSKLTIDSLRQWGAGSELRVAASATSRKALKTGMAVTWRHARSNRRLPVVADRRSGQVLEVMKEVSIGRKVVVGTAAATAIAVSAAHMISAADLARTLKLVDQKLDLLLAYRQIDHAARLERLYSAAQELLALPFDESLRTELRRLRGDLRELRATWRMELEHHLGRIEDPAEASWIERTFTRQSLDRKVHGKISEGPVRLAMLEYALRLDVVLVIASDTWQVSERTLSDEINAIERVGGLLKQKAAFISSKSPHLTVQPLVEGIDSLVAKYRELLGPSARTSERSLRALTEAAISDVKS